MLVACLLFSSTAGDPLQASPRVAIAGLFHESNSFNPEKTGLEDFQIRPLGTPQETLAEWAKTNDPIAGFIEGAGRLGLSLYPTLVAAATPKGPVTDHALDTLVGRMLEKLESAPDFDGLFLDLHGAMVVESHPHGDAEVLRRVRSLLGPDFPVVVMHDFHANVSEDIVELSTALITYKENPHLDTKERGFQAAEIMAGILEGRYRPRSAVVKPPMIYNILYQNTFVEPLKPIVDESRRLEQRHEILAASVSGGYQYADVPAMGPSVVVVTHDDPDLAQREARRLADLLWETRDRLVLDLPGPSEAVQRAEAATEAPVVLVDLGDNIGGGTPGDSTHLLAELVGRKARGWVMTIRDPEAVRLAVEAGIDQPFEAQVGGKTDEFHGDPILIRGRVRSLHDGRYYEPEVRHGGSQYFDQGLTAVIEVEGSTPDLASLLMLTTDRQSPNSLHQLIAHGIYPERQRILVVKAAIAFRAAYEPVAAKIIEVDTPGATAVNPNRFEFHHLRGPMFGLD